MKKKYLIETYGCQMNMAESESLKLLLDSADWEETRNPEEADAVILNTCSVRETAEERIWGRLGFYKHEKKKHNFKLVVMGCMAERLKEKFLVKNSHIDIVVGAFDKKEIPYYLEESFQQNEKIIATNGSSYDFFERHSRDSFKAFVPIMHGCNNFCSYCIVPYVRGREVSRSPEQIIEELTKLVDEGVKEVTLLGQNVNSYRYKKGDLTITFPDLLEMIITNVKVEWLRFLTSHPKDLSNRVIKLIAENEQLCNHIHLPVQHGSNKILKLMRRGYTRENYLEIINKIKTTISDISITTDILLGFPEETEEDFEETLSLMEKVNFDDSFIYRYNPREGTKAFELGDPIPYEVKIERLNRAFVLQKRLSYLNRKKRLGRKVKVLAESISRHNPRELLGRTEWDEMVVFPGEPGEIGKFLFVTLEELRGNTYRGRKVENDDI